MSLITMEPEKFYLLILTSYPQSSKKIKQKVYGYVVDYATKEQAEKAYAYQDANNPYALRIIKLYEAG